MHVINDYVAIACADGAVRFYDYFLRLEAWFEDFAAGPLSSLSFACQKCSYPDGEAGAPGLQFWVPDFIVGTTDAFIVGAESSLFDEIKADDRRGTLVMQVLLCICYGALHVNDRHVIVLAGYVRQHHFDSLPSIKSISGDCQCEWVSANVGL